VFLGFFEMSRMSRVQLANVELHIWKHVISGIIKKTRLLGKSVTYDLDY
jgi:hypothetical protein